jgi:hypothetical protein
VITLCLTEKPEERLIMAAICRAKHDANWNVFASANAEHRDQMVGQLGNPRPLDMSRLPPEKRRPTLGAQSSSPPSPGMLALAPPSRGVQGVQQTMPGKGVPMVADNPTERVPIEILLGKRGDGGVEFLSTGEALVERALHRAPAALAALVKERQMLGAFALARDPRTNRPYRSRGFVPFTRLL